jgi:hypothetical protein
MTDGWKIRGELILSCNCDVFCPCVIALGQTKPHIRSINHLGGIQQPRGTAGGENQLVVPPAWPDNISVRAWAAASFARSSM